MLHWLDHSKLVIGMNIWKTLDNNDLNKVVASSGFSENNSWFEWGNHSRGLIIPGLGRSY